jgi:hypothetical protein
MTPSESDDQWDVITDAGNMFKMSYDTSIDMIVFKVMVKPGAWFGIGFGESMTNTDIISFYGQGDNGNVVDQYSFGQSQPAKDESQDVEWTSSRDDKLNYIFVAKRKLVTGDSLDFEIELSKKISMIWA